MLGAPSPVHPRLRGEHLPQQARSGRRGGSSPPARGTLQPLPRFRKLGRFIPACAGNTSARDRRLAQRPVHPRLRGEHSQCVLSARKANGSSPPARGTRREGGWHQRLPRFIPACAGNTAPCRSIWPRRPVHPRLRGEHYDISVAGRAALGSSPPARGTPSCGRSLPCAHRFIPACAGNTATKCSQVNIHSVHPRLRGEHSSRRALFHKAFYNVKKPTDLSALRRSSFVRLPVPGRLSASAMARRPLGAAAAGAPASGARHAEDCRPASPSAGACAAARREAELPLSS